MMVEVLLLGPVQARDDSGEVVDLGARARRTALAALAEDVGRVVSVDALIERLWGEDAPATATNIVQAYVAKLARCWAKRSRRGRRVMCFMPSRMSSGSTS